MSSSIPEATPVWERSKENAAPLERGRNVSRLEASFMAREDTSYEGAEAQQQIRRDMDRQVQHFERLVRRIEQASENKERSSRESDADGTQEDGDFNSEDPLIHWLSYIKYHQDAFPSDTHYQFLLLERCFRSILHCPAYQDQYRNDVRFVRVCVLYAERTSRALELFRYLYQQRIGTGTATFYMAWAWKAEKEQDYDLTDQILTKGIAKHAKPKHSLVQRLQQFQRRMKRRIRTKAAMEQEGEDRDEEGGRGTLGGLSQEALKRNDRSHRGGSVLQRPRMPNMSSDRTSSSLATFTDRSRVTSSRAMDENTHQLNSQNMVSSGGFAIYADDAGGGGNQSFLDESGGVERLHQERQLEREQERLKENTAMTERWNERGGLQNSVSMGRPSVRAAATLPQSQNPSFAVFVDEECAARQEMIDRERSEREDRQRRTRDERTFREREVGDTVMEKLTRDPLRYVRDASRIESDRLEERSGSHVQSPPPASRPGLTKLAEENSRKNRGSKRKKVYDPADLDAAFDPNLLKTELGEERCFEEARAFASYYALAPVSSNVNRFTAETVKTDSSMELDESMEDVTMDDSKKVILSCDASLIASTASPVDQRPPLGSAPRGIIERSRLEMGSFDDVTPRNASTTSSTVDEAIAVGGAPTGKEEQTINTQWAMKEISMMFSSPAVGVVHEEGTPRRNQSFELSQNLITNNQSSVSLEAAKEDRRSSCGSKGDTACLDDLAFLTEKPEKIPKVTEASPDDARLSQESVIRSSLKGNKSITGSATVTQPKKGGLSFQIFEDDGESNTEQDECDSSCGSKGDTACLADLALLTIHEVASDQTGVEGPAVPSTDGHHLTNRHYPRRFQIFEDSAIPKTDLDSCSIQRDIKQTVAFQVDSIIRKDRNSSSLSSEDEDAEGDTASLSALNALLEDSIGAHVIGSQSIDLPVACGSQIVSSPNSNPNGSILDLPGFGDVSCIANAEDVTATIGYSLEKSVNYFMQHELDMKEALKRLRSKAQGHLPPSVSLSDILSRSGLICDCPTDVIPRSFRTDGQLGRKDIRIGRSTATVKLELGRGAYGIVALLDAKEGDECIAVKAQRPPGCLAWEYEVMRKIEERLGDRLDTRLQAFPKAFSFVALADGALLGMSAASSSGLNLVDLVNIYKVRLGETVPEIIALHFVSIMLTTLELMHWHGKVLHCDTKPDNWVLCDSAGAGHPCQGSDLMLVDFGRAVDLETIRRQGSSAMETKLSGHATTKDMMCVAMRLGRPWSFDVDTFGVCAAAHVLLFGQHLEIKKKAGDNRWAPTLSIPKDFQKDVWDYFFDSLLNIDDMTHAAIGSHPQSVKTLRCRIDDSLRDRRGELIEALQRQATILPLCRDEIAT